jgi:hypothetical protein
MPRPARAPERRRILHPGLTDAAGGAGGDRVSNDQRRIRPWRGQNLISLGCQPQDGPPTPAPQPRRAGRARHGIPVLRHDQSRRRPIGAIDSRVSPASILCGVRSAVRRPCVGLVKWHRPERRGLRRDDPTVHSPMPIFICSAVEAGSCVYHLGPAV